MDRDERCPLYPSFPRAYCAHCQGSIRGTPENPNFSLKYDFDPAYGTTVEVLKNGGPIHSHDEHFRFGRRKAEMLVACLPVLQEFRLSSDTERLQFKQRVIEDRARGLIVRISVEMYPEFVRSTGQTVERPWLRLQALSPDNHHIGLGAMKCRAICAVQESLKVWLQGKGTRGYATGERGNQAS
jgi:hypothetical protein